MSKPNVRDILTVPGRLSVGPTDLLAPYPHGGTALGIVLETVLILDVPYQSIIAEEYGERVEGIVTGQGCALGFLLRGWDFDTLDLIFPNVAAGAASGRARISAPGTIRPGEPMSNRSVVLLFTPDDIDRHPMFLMRRALPAVRETAEIALRLDQEYGVPAIFVGIRDTSGRLYEVGLAHDLQPVLA